MSNNPVHHLNTSRRAMIRHDMKKSGIGQGGKVLVTIG